MAVSWDYSTEQFAAILAVLRRAAPDIIVDGTSLKKGLHDLLVASGSVVDDEFGETFNETASRQMPPSELGRFFHLLTTNRTIPLRKFPIDFGEMAGRVILSKLRAQLRAYHPTRASDLDVTYDQEKRRLVVTGLEDAPEIFHQAAGRLAVYYERSLKRGPKGRSDLDTLLIALADIFIMVTESDAEWLELPHGDRSHFIRFSHAALSPVFGGGEAEANPLAQRWHKIKAAGGVELHSPN